MAAYGPRFWLNNIKKRRLNFSKSEVKNPKSTLILLVLDIDAVRLILSVFWISRGFLGPIIISIFAGFTGILRIFLCNRHPISTAYSNHYAFLNPPCISNTHQTKNTDKNFLLKISAYCYETLTTKKLIFASAHYLDQDNRVFISSQDSWPRRPYFVPKKWPCRSHF